MHPVQGWSDNRNRAYLLGFSQVDVGVLGLFYSLLFYSLKFCLLQANQHIRYFSSRR
jgi:hypothetical protein